MIEKRLEAFPLRKSRDISYREAGAGPALVLLHGIGSGSDGWLNQLEGLASRYRVIAWDAPGYGESAFLPEEKPHPRHYAEALHGLIERLLLKDVCIVANSLGGLFAGAYARAHGDRVRRMLLVSPTLGYGPLTPAEQKEKFDTRMKNLAELGPEGLAEKRSPALFGKRMTPEALELARRSQRRIRPDGYRQAVWCLSNGNHLDDARHYRKPVLVVCGSEDTVTPEPGCRQIAQAYPEGKYQTLLDLGHVAHMEDPGLVNSLIGEFA